MKIFIVIIASLVLISGVAYTQVHSKLNFRHEEESVLSAETKEEPIAENVVEEKKSEEKNVSPFTQKSTITPTPTRVPSVTKKPQTSTFINDFVYPGSEVMSSDDNSLKLRSPDDTENITNWYKDKIRSLDMNVKSFVTTKTNNNILNKLVGANGDFEISIEIKKDPVNNYSEISVSYSNN